MTDNKNTEQPEAEPGDDQDVEGHNMWINPTLNADMARNRSKELEKEARDRNRAKEAKRS